MKNNNISLSRNEAEIIMLALDSALRAINENDQKYMIPFGRNYVIPNANSVIKKLKFLNWD